MVKTGKGQAKTRWQTRKLNIKEKKWVKSSAGQQTADGDIEEITDPTHPLLALLQKPTQDPNGIGSYDLRYCTQLYLESLGKAYWWKPKNGLGTPSEIWLLRSHMVQEIPNTKQGDVIAGYRYGKQVLDPNDVIRFHNPDPYSLYYGGYSPMLAAIEKIRIGRKEDAHISALLDNMGRPDAIWSPKGDSEGGGIGEQEARRMESTFRTRYRMAGRGGIMVAESPGQLEVLGWKPQDIVEIERAKAIKTDIANAFDVPDALLERNAANLAGAKTADYSHAKYGVNPRCHRFQEVINTRLVPDFDPTGRTFIVYDNPIPEDEVFELETTRASAGLGAITVDEIRAAVGEEPIGGPAGGMRYINGAPIGPDGLPIIPKPDPAPLAKPKKKKQLPPPVIERDDVSELLMRHIEGEALTVANVTEVVEKAVKDAAPQPVSPAPINVNIEQPAQQSIDSYRLERDADGRAVGFKRRAVETVVVESDAQIAEMVGAA